MNFEMISKDEEMEDNKKEKRKNKNESFIMI